MTGHCVPAASCHCASTAAFSPALFSASTSTFRSDPPSSSAAAAPLLVPKPKPVDSEDNDSGDCTGCLAIGLAGLVVAAFILIIMFA
ncbi:hypothetical protein BS78_01G065300 [Paspalum vaginatum]|nr:hypothetical protein BS78_01G065300 [Paspalum vaginatum]